MNRFQIASTSLVTLLCAAPAGCGGEPSTKHMSASREGTKHATAPARRPASHASRLTVPAARADGSSWPEPPGDLKAVIRRKVLLAGRVKAGDVTALGCNEGPNQHEPTSRFLNATVDEFSLKATFRETVPRDAGGEVAGEPIVWDCSAKWSSSARSWRTVPCQHYAPAVTLNMVSYSGGGMLDSCDLYSKSRLSSGPYALIWLVPPPESRWLVVYRGNRYAVAYPVHKREPVRVLYLLADAPLDRRAGTPLGRVFRFDAVTRADQVFHVSVHGYTAG
jgi:hypothetical protein